jgi:hypothetical protein
MGVDFHFNARGEFCDDGVVSQRKVIFFPSYRVGQSRISYIDFPHYPVSFGAPLVPVRMAFESQFTVSFVYFSLGSGGCNIEKLIIVLLNRHTEYPYLRLV